MCQEASREAEFKRPDLFWVKRDFRQQYDVSNEWNLRNQTLLKENITDVRFLGILYLYLAPVAWYIVKQTAILCFSQVREPLNV